MNKPILVLGAGVTGLSTGILLLEKGYSVTIWAKDFPPNTTSNKAAAVWYPFVVNPLEKVGRWCRLSLDYFHQNILGDKESGAMPQKVIEIFMHVKEDPVWKHGVDSFRRLKKEELPPGYVDGWTVEGIVMDTTTYMDYLVKKFSEKGGKMIKKEVKKMEECLAEFDVIVNCTGLGSKELCNDNELYPCRGQTVKIKPNGFDYSMFEEEGPNALAYIIPRFNDIVLGGTTQNNDWELNERNEDMNGILSRCAKIYSQFKNVEVIQNTVGLRPARSAIRLEAENKGNGKWVVHNYGHGGAGFTLSWGCAYDAVEMVQQIG